MWGKVLFSFGIAVLVGIVGVFYVKLSLFLSLVSAIGVFILFVLLSFFGSRAKSELPIVSKETEDKSEAYKLLEKKFKAASEKAEKLEQEKKTTEMFLASMSHEIRTPLNGIIGLTEVLDGTALDEEQKEFVSLIRESSNNLRVIVDDVLEISKLNSGKMELESIPFDIARKIESSVGLFTPRFQEKQIVQTVTIDPALPTDLIGDPTRLSQVITNLVSNAIKFTHPGGHIDVTADLIERKEGNVALKIAVKDTGIGLSKEQQERIFDAYSQASASTTRTAGGTGLGLTISRKIVHSMGGKLSVESEEGKGATFFFTITLKEAEKAQDKRAVEEPVPSVASKTEEVPTVTEESKALKVLVAEDNPINQKLIRIVLENMGLVVTLADNGQKALEARKEGAFDLIFMDIQMPVMGGEEATQAILAFEKEQGLIHVPIIALTANALAGDREKYIQQGMDDYATKPLDVKVIESLIEKYCQRA